MRTSEVLNGTWTYTKTHLEGSAARGGEHWRLRAYDEAVNLEHDPLTFDDEIREFSVLQKREKYFTWICRHFAARRST
jgi:hypothetical protein